MHRLVATAVFVLSLQTVMVSDGQTRSAEDRRAERDFDTRRLERIPGARGSVRPTHKRSPIPIGRDGVVTRAPNSPFSMFVLPDTQGYVDGGCYRVDDQDLPCFLPEAFMAQTRYIRRYFDHPLNNAIFVAHLGDVVDDARRGLEWRRARRAMQLLHGKHLFVPYGIAPGNHDFRSWRDGKNEFSAYNRHFSLAAYRRNYPKWRAWLGGAHLGFRNSSHLFNAGGDGYLALFLEYCPDDQTIAWAKRQLRRHASRRVLVVTHAATDRHGRWLKRCLQGKPGNSGKKIWTRLIRPSTTIHFVLAGHAGYGLGWNAWLRKRNDKGRITGWWRRHGWNGGTYAKHRAADGHLVRVLISNYQHMYRGGHGFLRRMKFVPKADRIEILTYSPYARRFLRDDDPRCDDRAVVNDGKHQVMHCNNFVLDYKMTGN